MEFSPMMKQYMEIKNSHKECILFFRLGDFYEMFFEDALIASKVLEITLTGRDCGQEERAPMCGIPYHASEIYIQKLLDKGFKVAICEQVEDPKDVKGIVKREVVRIVTKGTLMNSEMLDSSFSNFLMSVFGNEQGIGIAYTDISTGEIYSTEFQNENISERVLNEIVKIEPKEIICNDYFFRLPIIDEIKFATTIIVESIEGFYKSDSRASEIINDQFKVKSMAGIGLLDSYHSIKALGGLLLYLRDTQKQMISSLRNLKTYSSNVHMSLDRSTLRNLEITETLYEKKIEGSLLHILDHTKTSMGSRKLKKWLKEPLLSAVDINNRLNSVEVLLSEILMRNNIKESLKMVYDLERLSGKIAFGNANPRDLIALKNSLAVLPEIKYELKGCGDFLLEEIQNEIHILNDVVDLIERGIVDAPSLTIKDGNIIKENFSAELDEMKYLIKDGQHWISDLEKVERERTGIKNLKVGFNKVFGYYIDVTRSYYDLVPDNYIRKQTLSNCERFYTTELKEVEAKVLNAESKINILEQAIFSSIKEEIKDSISLIQMTSSAISSLDVLISYAEISHINSYVKPIITNDNKIQIFKGRHPVVEQTIKDGNFVSNDTFLDSNTDSLLLITGPNMAGKSTYMRQTALIVLMAQIGCFVPCEKAEIGIVDKIFTRIGASDNLSQGQSTFYVEMSELAYILNTFTEKSFIILDEIGRGTSTYDGLSIAYSVVEYLCKKDIRPKAMFASHYHELTELEGQINGLKNLNVSVIENNGAIIFLHKIIAGYASRSYGIHVAKIAGVPDEVILNAERVLLELEEESIKLSLKESHKDNETIKSSEQLSIFSNKLSDDLINKIKSIKLMDSTPSSVISLLEELKEEIYKKGL
jgi:DNA mismatch repair protein MutS